MSRYQMYWQVYFHPVTRSAETLLNKIFQRAKQLYEDNYAFGFMLPPMLSLFHDRLTVEDYLLLDESVIQTVLTYWSFEQDVILADLCSRFLHRRLFKYTTIEHPDKVLLQRLEQALLTVGFDPAFYMEVHFPSDLSYDVYRPGEHDEKLPILLLDDQENLTEISRKSDIVRSISGIHKGKYHLYYPHELIVKHMPQLDPDLQRLLGG
jgi:uncharacterized protein